MDNIKEAIYSHLKMKTTGALLLTGEWGSGKTYYLKNEIIPNIENETGFIPIIVSLFGETDKNNIAQKVLFAYFDKKGENVNLSTGTIAKNLKNLTEAIPFVKNYVDINKLIIGTGDNLFKFLPHEKLLIIFDDVERMGEDINVNDFLGIINELVENKGSKVLLVANEEEIKDEIAFKEKTIEKTIHYSPRVSSIYDSIIKIYGDGEFKNYLIHSKEFILKTINPSIENEADEKELQKSFKNIRTLKFAIEHFRYAFEIVFENTDNLNDIQKSQLKSIWLFTIAVSIEFKKLDNLSFKERKNLDKQTNSISNIVLKDLGIDSGEPETENEWTYSNKFVELYYDRLSETYLYFPDIYNLITSSKKIDKAEFINQLDASFNIQEGVINPAHELLNKFMREGYWTFSNIEFPEKLVELLTYAETGKLDDVVSYLNAGVYLLGFIEFIEFSKEEIIQKLKSGIDILVSQTKPNHLVRSQLDMVSGNFSDPDLKQVISYIKEKFTEIEATFYNEEAIRLQILLIDSPSLFVKEFLPDNSGFRTPDKPFYHLFDQESIKKAVGKWEPASIMDLTSLLKIRYLDTSFSDGLKEEKVFLESMQSGISELPLINSLSNHMLKTQLFPRIEVCIEKLK